MYIYDVPQLNSCHWELTSWPLNWYLVSYFHILAEPSAKDKKRLVFYFLSPKHESMKSNLSQKAMKLGLNDNWGTFRYLMNWIQVVYFKLKEIWPLFSTAKAKKLSSFFTSLDESMKANLSQKAMKFTEELLGILWIEFKLFISN